MKQHIKVLLLLVLAIFVVADCGGSNSPGETSVTTSEAEAAFSTGTGSTALDATSISSVLNSNMDTAAASNATTVSQFKLTTKNDGTAQQAQMAKIAKITNKTFATNPILNHPVIANAVLPFLSKAAGVPLPKTGANNLYIAASTQDLSDGCTTGSASISVPDELYAAYTGSSEMTDAEVAQLIQDGITVKISYNNCVMAGITRNGLIEFAISMTGDQSNFSSTFSIKANNYSVSGGTTNTLTDGEFLLEQALATSGTAITYTMGFAANSFVYTEGSNSTGIDGTFSAKLTSTVDDSFTTEFCAKLAANGDITEAECQSYPFALFGTPDIAEFTLILVAEMTYTENGVDEEILESAKVVVTGGHVGSITYLMWVDATAGSGYYLVTFTDDGAGHLVITVTGSDGSTTVNATYTVSNGEYTVTVGDVTV